MCVTETRSIVNDMLASCQTCYNNFVFSEHLLRKYISALKPGSSPGNDGISAEQIKMASSSRIVFHLCKLFTVCFRYGLVPLNFMQGILVPILKKPILGPADPKNYRPVIISNILSKNVEMHIIDECSDFKFSEFQFGYLKGRGTNTAISLAHDVYNYCIFNGSPVFMCSLDAEGAFDALPFPVIFTKIANVVSDSSWKILYNW